METSAIVVQSLKSQGIEYIFGVVGIPGVLPSVAPHIPLQ